MEHGGEDPAVAAPSDPLKMSEPPPHPDPNQMKRRNSQEKENGEKRLRENEDENQSEQTDPLAPTTPVEGVAVSPTTFGESDPQMQVSSLESDYNEPVVNSVPGEGIPHEAPELPNDPENTLPDNTETGEPPVEDHLDSKSKDDEPSTSTAAEEKKKNVTNLRKNIRDVIDDTMLDASTLAAQREEQERLNRVQEQQRALRALHRQTDLDKRQSSILSLLQGTLDPTNDSSISAVRVLDKKSSQILEDVEGLEPIPSLDQLEPGEIPNPALAAVQLKEAQLSLQESRKPEKKDVVTIDDSSDDDCIMLSDEEEEPEDDDPHNSGLHVNDTYNVADDEGRVLVNFGHADTEKDVFVAPQIARALKPHQIGGIRFLYDNIIESLDRFDSSTGFGCILAHSMGLGKTLQLVCFCDIFLRHTSAKTVLCIMPINTLQNWLAEFNWWLPEDESTSPLREFGEVRGRNFKIHVLNDSQKTIAARSKVVLNWAKSGGVLLIGYELYRLLCLKKVVKKRGKRAEKDPKFAEKEQAAHGELLDEIYAALVKPGPDLVVCDEGHRIKSSHASTSVALKQIRTKRRVVLTGYPLQNNLLEYWCMVDFVRPNYLGTKTEFCNMFEKPIQNGQCIDSTPQDIKLMRYRAHVLHSLLLGFVQRRSHLVLQSTLPNKLEYVLLVRMTAFQRKLYDVFMNEVVRKKAVPNPLKAFAVCCKIWNHPDVLYNFLKKREADLDLELEEELALVEAKKVKKEKKAKELKEAGEKPKEGESAQSEIKTASNYSNPGMDNRFGGNSFSGGSLMGYNNTTDPNAPYPGYGNTGGDYYAQYPNTNQPYQPHLGYESHQQYYNNMQGLPNDTAKEAKAPFWGNNDQYSNGYYSKYSQSQGFNANEVPTTVAAGPKEEEVVATEKGAATGEAEDEDEKKKADTTQEKESKSSKDDGIPYEWAVELMKDYVPDLLENAPKMEIFFCILRESLAVGDRILVFSQSLLTLNLIERFLQKNKVPQKEEFWAKNTNYFRLDGSTTACDRERLINEFNTNTDVAIFLVSTRAGSLGINLVGANRVIVFDASWNPCHDTQAVCRVYRYGQKKQCYVYRLVMDNCLEKRIYDRQVNKQGMSDRVVDECNPDAHLSIKEVTNLCWDNEEDTEVKDFSDKKDEYPDTVMQKILEKFSTSLSKEPFRHESLLVDRKEKKLSMAEKRLAQRGYELEKQASTKSTAYNPGKVTQYRVFRTADGSLVHRAVGSVPSTTTNAPIPINGGKWIPAEVWRQQGMTTQETTLPADVTIPSNSGDKNAGIVLKAGSKVMILKSSKGVYMQLETGKIIAIRTGPKPTPGGHPPAQMNVPRPRGFGANEVIKLDDDDDEEEEKKKTANSSIPGNGGKTTDGKDAASSSSSSTAKDSHVIPQSSQPLPQSNTNNSGASSSSSSSSGYYSSGSYGQVGGSYQRDHRQEAYASSSSDPSAGAKPTGIPNRDYNSSYPGNYMNSDYPQGQKDYAQSTTSNSHPPVAPTYPSSSGGTYDNLYGQSSSVDSMPSNNGQYGSGQQPPMQSGYAQTGYDYSNRYYDQSKYNPYHAGTGTSGYSMTQPMYPYQHQHQHQQQSTPQPHLYPQHKTMPGEYNPNNPPYYMNPYNAMGQSAEGGSNVSAYPAQPYGQDQLHQGQGQVRHNQQAYGGEVYTQPQPSQYGNIPYNGQQVPAPQMAKVDAAGGKWPNERMDWNVGI